MAKNKPSGSIRIDPDLYERLRQWCADNGHTIRWAIEQGVKRTMGEKK